ncbi:hypothetical protein ACFVJK_48580, partial [Streptomyces sp. NPDC127172]|uniref:hypothetical protein n=1 Tax=Streptomyces sp. NPDC127172 TaxID=3345382 RepID=UPI0036259D16
PPVPTAWLPWFVPPVFPIAWLPWFTLPLFPTAWLPWFTLPLFPTAWLPWLTREGQTFGLGCLPQRFGAAVEAFGAA